MLHRAGSSPLTRGKRQASCVDVLLIGLIPAHAGKTCRGRSPVRRCRAHPRSRGENAAGVPSCDFAAGSSPLTRGKRVPGEKVGYRSGLIPAHAGKTSSPPSWEPGRAAHPRSRGENFLIVNVERKVDGSSPLTRGKHQTDRVRIHSRGLIPAHAGKTRV